MQDEMFYGAAYRSSGQSDQHQQRNRDAGSFGSEDHAEKAIDLNEQLIRNKPATFFMRVRGDAMAGAGIHDGDIVIVDRSLKPGSGRVIIAILNGEMLIRRLEKTFNKIRLLPDTPKLSAIEVDTYNNEFSIWGVVTYCIHAC